MVPLLAWAKPPAIRISRADRPPALEDFLSAATARPPAVTSFIQRDPVEGQPASQTTSVFLAYDSEHLYLIFQCFDDEPEKIRARMSKRDDFFEDDFISVRLDTFHDRRRAFQFTSNPLGVQGDAIHDESRGLDNSFDTLWYSRAQLTSWGYAVWMAIPWKSLRFPNSTEHTWGILFTRRVPRNNELSYWPAVSRNVTNYLVQAADLEGIREISPPRNMQFIPYGSFFASQYPDFRAGRFVQKNTGDFGVDAKAVLRDNLALDVTINPDFSQVESDEPQVTVNRRFEVYFPEKRPFFIENANYFQTPITLFFSRRIAEPQFGVRLTGKQGRYAIGALIADDQAPGHSDTPELAGQRASFAVFRVNRDIARESTAGAIFAERRFAGGWNRVTGLDTRLKLPREFFLTAQGVASVSHFEDGRTVSAPGVWLMLDHYDRHWSYRSLYTDYGANFRADAGFVPRVDLRSHGTWLTYSFRPGGRRRLVRWGPDLYMQQVWDRQGVRQDYFCQVGALAEWRGQTMLTASYRPARERYAGQDFDRRAVIAQFQTALSKRWSFQTLFRAGREVVYQPSGGRPPFQASGIASETGFTLRPVPRLRMDQAVLITRLRGTASGEAVFTNAIFREKVNWQFNRALSLRAIAQYDSTAPNAALSALNRGKRFSGDVLLSYVLHPSTALYAGYAHRLENLDSGLGRDPLGAPLYTSALFPAGKQFFAKVSYLYRF